MTYFLFFIRAGPTVASRSDTVLITHTDYNSAGNAYLITDPHMTESYFDMLRRTLETIQASDNGGPATGLSITTWTYDGANHVITMTAEFPGTSTNNRRSTRHHPMSRRSLIQGARLRCVTTATRPLPPKQGGAM